MTNVASNLSLKNVLYYNIIGKSPSRRLQNIWTEDNYKILINTCSYLE